MITNMTCTLVGLQLIHTEFVQNKKLIQILNELMD